MRNLGQNGSSGKRVFRASAAERLLIGGLVGGLFLTTSAFAGYPMSENERSQLRSQLLQLIGPFPQRCPLRARVISQENKGKFTLKKVEYDTEPGLVVPAWLLVPHGRGPFPAILAHHQHGGQFYVGKEQVVRIMHGYEDQAYGLELAERG